MCNHWVSFFAEEEKLTEHCTSTMIHFFKDMNEKVLIINFSTGNCINPSRTGKLMVVYLYFGS